MAWLLIDGHNLIFQTPVLAQQYKRYPALVIESLVRQAQQIGDIRPWKVVLIFDGNASHFHSTHTSATVEILFSAHNQSADALIEKLSKKIPAQEDIYIVTADQAIAATTHSPRTYILSPEWFLNETQSAQHIVSERLRRISQKAQW
jgi:predicted RNA-binding protein with PIN domain